MPNLRVRNTLVREYQVCGILRLLEYLLRAIVEDVSQCVADAL